MQVKKYRFLVVPALLLILLSCFPTATPGSDDQPLVYSLKVDDTVTTGTAGHIQRGLNLADKHRANAVVILLDTPGGLVSATLDIIQAMSSSAIPVITYVNPQGAIAASAGTFILINGHVAAMAPGTTCGAAMPVSLSAPGEAPRAADQKTINFLAGHMKSIARERGRPAELAEKFVTENLALSNSEALDKGITDLNATSLSDLLEKVHGMTVRVQGCDKRLETSGARLVEIPPATSERFIHIVGNPTLATVLLMIGIYGLIIGFYSPGFFLPEVLGAISIILGLFGMGLFQVNLAAALLILLGIGLLVAELFTPTYGILGIGGLASLVLGILFLPLEPLMPVKWFSALKAAAIGIGIAGVAFLAIVTFGLSRIRRYRPVHGEDEFKNTTAHVVNALDPEGLVKIKGETWRAVSENGHTISARVICQE